MKPPGKGRGKYNAVPTYVDDIRFDSKKEAARYAQLKLLAHGGLITELTVHPRFNLWVYDKNGKSLNLCAYEGDFRYFDVKKQKYVVEDTKGVRTMMYKLKKKLFQFLSGEPIVEL